jgi:hypothetical protein
LLQQLLKDATPFTLASEDMGIFKDRIGRLKDGKIGSEEDLSTAGKKARPFRAGRYEVRLMC